MPRLTVGDENDRSINQGWEGKWFAILSYASEPISGSLEYKMNE